MSKKLKIAPGIWEIVERHSGVPNDCPYSIDVQGRSQERRTTVYPVCQSPSGFYHQRDNATLIVDAGNTYNACHILPSQLLKERDELLKERDELLKERDGLLRDRERLDFLDRANASFNAHYNRTYRWELTMNHNVVRLMLPGLAVDLNDTRADGLPSCRDAIDAQIAKMKAVGQNKQERSEKLNNIKKYKCDRCSMEHELDEGKVKNKQYHIPPSSCYGGDYYVDSYFWFQCDCGRAMEVKKEHLLYPDRIEKEYSDHNGVCSDKN